MPALVIEIFKEDEQIDVREGVSAKSGQPWKMQSQVVYAHVKGKFPVRTSVPIAEGQLHYAAGKYELDASSFVVGDFDRLGFGREMLLVPIGKSF